MTAATEILVVPDEGAFLTDGKRLGQFIGLTPESYFILEDCNAPVGSDERIIVPPSDFLEGGWRVVRPSDGD